MSASHQPDWTLHEEAVLCRWWGRDHRQVLALLPSRSKTAIKQRAYVMRRQGRLRA